MLMDYYSPAGQSEGKQSHAVSTKSRNVIINIMTVDRCDAGVTTHMTLIRAVALLWNDRVDEPGCH